MLRTAIRRVNRFRIVSALLRVQPINSHNALQCSSAMIILTRHLHCSIPPTLIKYLVCSRLLQPMYFSVISILIFIMTRFLATTTSSGALLLLQKKKKKKKNSTTTTTPNQHLMHHHHDDSTTFVGWTDWTPRYSPGLCDGWVRFTHCGLNYMYYGESAISTSWDD